MIERITQTRWRCPHCRKSWASKSRAATHECWHDPELRSCPSCVHRYMADDEQGDPDGERRPHFIPSCAIDEGNPNDRPPPRHCPSWELTRRAP